MNNGNDSRGITVVSTIPESHQTDVDINSTIQITFSADLNKSTLNNCIVVFEDYRNVYNGVTSLKDTTDFNIVKGKLSYENMVLTFTPEKPFSIDTRYIVLLNNNIKDITGSPLLKKYVFAFNTEIMKSFCPCEIVGPKYGSINAKIPSLEWKEIGAPSYILQVSKGNKFETLLLETFIVPDESNVYRIKDDIKIQPEEVPPEERPYNVIHVIPDILPKEGVYYFRVKAEGGKWSEVSQFFIKEVTDAVIAKEDQDDTLYLDEFLNDLEEELEILELFPPDGSILNSLKTNIFYIKIKGRIDESRLTLSDFEVVGEPFDEEDDTDENFHDYTHGTVSGSWSMVYDELYDCTYVIFTPSIPEDVEDILILTAISGENLEATATTES